MAHHIRVRAGMACGTADPDLFFPESGDLETIARAVDICRTCPVLADCAGEALTLGTPDGVVAATWLGEGDRGRRRTARSRLRLIARTGIAPDGHRSINRTREVAS